MPEPVVGLRGEGDARQQAADYIAAEACNVDDSHAKAARIMGLLLVRVQEEAKEREWVGALNKALNAANTDLTRRVQEAERALRQIADPSYVGNYDAAQVVEIYRKWARAVLGGDVQEQTVLEPGETLHLEHCVLPSDHDGDCLGEPVA